MEVRPAEVGDVPELIRLRALMFRSMGVADDGDWRDQCAEHLRRGLRDGAILAEVVDRPGADDRLAACGVAVVNERLPGPGVANGRYGYIQSVVTDEGYRRLGLARAVMVVLIAKLERRGVAAIDLHATAEGEELYRSLGFGDSFTPELQRRSSPR